MFYEHIIADNVSDKMDYLTTVYTVRPWGARDFGAGEEILVYFSLWVCYNNNSNAAFPVRATLHTERTNTVGRRAGRVLFASAPEP